MRDEVYEEKLTKEQRELLVLDTQFKRELAETIGRIIIFTIVIINIIMSVVELIVGFGDVFGLILSIVFSVALIFLAFLAYTIPATFLLFSKPVQEYMYWAKNG